jgi:hypothetical protein
VTQQPEPNATANHDESWKSAIEQYLEAFMAFFFPQAHQAIDWERGYEFLEQELLQIAPDAEFGKRFVDKLVKVWLVDGEETWLLLHLEIQSQTDSGFARRMFIYHYRIFDRYGREVVSLALLGDDDQNWRPQEYGYGRWGSEMRLRFPIVKLLDYVWEDLESSDSPFAAVVMAHRQTQSTTQNATDRLQWKIQLSQNLYRRGYSKRDILELALLLDRMMTLPKPLELTFRDEMRKFEEENQMTYMSTFERLGRQEKARDLIQSLLKSRFNVLDEALIAIVEPLAQMPDDEIAPLLLTASKEELLERFGQGT